jgi:hypothetical protein
MSYTHLTIVVLAPAAILSLLSQLAAHISQVGQGSGVVLETLLLPNIEAFLPYLDQVCTTNEMSAAHSDTLGCLQHYDFTQDERVHHGL